MARSKGFPVIIDYFEKGLKIIGPGTGVARALGTLPRLALAPAPPPAHAAILSPMDIDERIRLALRERHDISLAYLFGSCVSGTARPGSDVDVAILLFDHLPTPALLDRLTEDLGAATERRVDLVVLNAAPPLLAREVIARGRLVMCRDEDERVRFETRTTARYQDTAHLRRVQYAYLRERAEAHRAGSR